MSAASGDGCNVVGQCTTVYTHVPAEDMHVLCVHSKGCTYSVWNCGVYGLHPYARWGHHSASGLACCCCQIAIGEAIKHFSPENPCHLSFPISLESARHERRSSPVAIAVISEQLLCFEAIDDGNSHCFIMTFPFSKTI